jgi:hypothetical protein
MSCPETEEHSRRFENAPPLQWVHCTMRAYKRASLEEGGGRMAESQLSELRNMRVLLEEARLLARDLAYHRRARLEAVLGQALDEVDRQIGELRTS